MSGKGTNDSGAIRAFWFALASPVFDRLKALTE